MFVFKIINIWYGIKVKDVRVVMRSLKFEMGDL